MDERKACFGDHQNYFRNWDRYIIKECTFGFYDHGIAYTKPNTPYKKFENKNFRIEKEIMEIRVHVKYNTIFLDLNPVNFFIRHWSTSSSNQVRRISGKLDPSCAASVATFRESSPRAVFLGHRYCHDIPPASSSRSPPPSRGLLLLCLGADGPLHHDGLTR